MEHTHTESKVDENKESFGSNRKGETYGKHAKMPIFSADMYKDVELPDLKQFNPDDIKLDATVVAIGKRRTGKSWVFRDIMWHMKDKIEAGIVISQTDELNKFWRQYIPEKYIYKKWNPDIIKAVFMRQKAILNDKNLTDEEKEKKAPFFILLDDVISDERLKYDEELRELFVAGRHYKLFVLITTQYARGIIPLLRGNTDYVFICKTLQGRQREALWEDYGDFLTKDAWNTIMDAYTEDNEVIVVDTSNNTSELLEMLMWYKAIDPGEFKFGSKKFHDSTANTGQKIPDDRLESWSAGDFISQNMFKEPFKQWANGAMFNG